MSIADRVTHDSARHAGRDSVPEPPLCYVKRPRLDATFAALVDGSRAIACVWGAAGSGKTTLLASWARRLMAGGQLVHWMTASEEPQASVEIQQLFRTPQLLAQGKQASYVFIDDAHRLTSGARAALFRTLESLPGSVRVVIAGRYQPFASLAFLEATGMLSELRNSELAFDTGEATRLATRHGIILSENAASAVVERTGGWATALVLAMPWIQGSEAPEEAIAQFGANHHAVADYLVTEVLRGLSDAERAVLLAAAVRECVPLELLSELSGRPDAGAIMHTLSRRNTLITEEDGDYRLHPVLWGFMRAEARRHDAAGAMRNHCTTARWYADQGDGVTALEHAVASANPGTIEEVLDRFGLELVLTGRTEALSKSHWSAAPQEEPLSSLVIKLLAQAPYAVDTRQARHLFALANQRVHARSPEGAAESWALALLAVSCFSVASESIVRERLKGLATPAAQALRDESFALDLLAATAEGWCFDRLGDPTAASALYRDVADAAHESGFTWLYLLATDLAVASLSVRGEWMQAAALEDQMEQSAQTIVGTTNSRAVAGAVILLAGRSYQRCEPIAVEMLDGVIAADPLGIEFGMLVPARMLRELPELDSSEHVRAAAERVERMSREAGHRFPRLVAAASVRLVSTRLALDGHELARELVDFLQGVLGADSLEVITARYVLHPPTHVGEAAERNLELALRGGARAWHAGAAISAWILLAQTAHDTGRESEADARITRAVRLAERFHAPRPFLARGGEGAALLESRLGRFGPLEAAAEHIMACAAEFLPQGSEERVLIEPLTAREREILLELPVHQSVAEIARKQTLSVNTVKTHLRNIYQKLSASGRSEAVKIAHQHHLL